MSERSIIQVNRPTLQQQTSTNA